MYSAFGMKQKQKKLNIAVARTAEILTKHFAKLSPAETKAMLKEIHDLASAGLPAVTGDLPPATRDLPPT